jgi:hypothetical protein
MAKSKIDRDEILGRKYFCQLYIKTARVGREEGMKWRYASSIFFFEFHESCHLKGVKQHFHWNSNQSQKKQKFRIDVKIER